MSIQATAVWEYWATGANTNGGGYDAGIAGAGTDYSQRATPILSLSDGAMTTGGNILGSATGGFTAAMVGNAVYLNYSGITSANQIGAFIVGYTNSNTVTLDRDITAGSSRTGMTVNVGGAWGVPTDAQWEALIGGNIVWMKSGTYTLTGSISIASASSTSAAPIRVFGYKTTRGDACNLTDRPAFAQGGNRVGIASYWEAWNIDFGGAVGSNSLVSGATGVRFVNCKFNNTSVTAPVAVAGNGTTIIDSEILCASGVAVGQGDPIHVIDCYIHDSTTLVTVGSNTSIIAINCIFDTATTFFIGNATARSRNMFVNCDVYNCATHVDLQSTPSLLFINTIFHTGTTGITNSTSVGSFLSLNSLFYNINTNVSNVTLHSSNITGQNPLLNDPANGDFTLQAGSPALNASLQIGTNVGAVGAYKRNIGVDQDNNAVIPNAHAWVA